MCLFNEVVVIGVIVGVWVGYYNYVYELEVEFDGVIGFEVFVGFFDECVVLEVDLYWVVCGGVDLVVLLECFGDCVIVVYVKDGMFDLVFVGVYLFVD